MMIYISYFCSKVEALFAKQTAFERLAENGCLIIASYLFISAISWLTYYLWAPSLIDYSLRKNVETDDRARLKWGHMAASTIHAVVTAFWSTYLWYSGALDESLEDRMWGYVPALGKLISFSVGYFLWDISCCIYNWSVYGKSFLVHAFMAFTATSFGLKPLMQLMIVRFLVYEWTTIFMNMHWVLVKTGYKGSKRLLINDGIYVLLYLIIRIGLGPYFSYLGIVDVYNSRFELAKRYISIVIAILIATNSLNYYWFAKICRSYYYTFIVKRAEKPKVSRRRRASRKKSD